MAADIPGIISVVVFYIVILVVGLIAGRKNKNGETSELLLAGRSLGLFVTILTTAATVVGINGTAEVMARNGLVWTIAPVGYNISLIIAALVYVPKVRKGNYTTIIDPLQEKYGNKTGSLLFIPELLGDLFWEAAVFAALGSTLAIVLDLDTSICIIVSACVAIGYTLFGGLYSVAYTDVVQLFFILVGVVLILPFAGTHPAVDFDRIQDTWKGTLDVRLTGVYIDTWLLCLGGSITWQAIYQRLLACKSPTIARNGAVVAGVVVLLLGIPSAFIGVIGSATDWNQTSYTGNSTFSFDDWSYVAPLVIKYLCPTAVSVLGMGAISAAVMSSADSIILATGSVVSINIYKNCFRPLATDRELAWVLRISILVVGALGAVIAIVSNSIYGLLILCADAMYVIQLPVLTCALWLPFANTYGAISGFIIGSVLRILGGEPVLSFQPILKYPWYDEDLGQLFPLKTFSMLCCLFSLVFFSYLTHVLFTKQYLSRKYDIFSCFQDMTKYSTKHHEMVELRVDKIKKDTSNEQISFIPKKDLNVE